jgi:drug/metabolite transporter (DMT)-like permease
MGTFTQVFYRVATIILCAAPFVTNIFDLILTPKFIGIGLINLVHIWTSYVGFQNLDTGISLSTFYSYPIFTVLLGAFFLGSKVSISTIFYLGLCIAGVIAVNMRDGDHDSNMRPTDSNMRDRDHDANMRPTDANMSTTDETPTSTPKNTTLGLLSIAVAALTEAIIIIFYKGATLPNSFDSLFSLYFYSLVPMLAVAPWFLDRVPLMDVAKVTGFNFFGGFIGYFLRLAAIPLLSVATFSGLSFTTIISGYIFGWLFFRESVGLNQLIGTLAIITGIFGAKSG